MFYKIECYIEVENKGRGETAIIDTTCDLAEHPWVLDHICISSECTAKEAKSAGLHRTTGKG